MTVLATDKAEAVRTTASTSFTEVLSKQFTLDHDGAWYRVIINCEYTVDNKNDKAFLQVTLDSVEVDLDCFKPDVADDPHKFTTMNILQIDSGSHTLAINARSVNGNMVSVRRTRLSVDKF